jgi:hypothetical protein
MPYTKSQARKTFDVEIDKMISVIKTTFSNIAISTDTKQYVLSCCVMLGTAKIEVYIEDFFDTWVSKINSTPLTASHLPNNLKALYINQPFLNNGFKKLIVENSESKYFDSIADQLGNSSFHLTDLTKPLPRLDAKRIYSKKKYPSPENVEALFKRIGINKVFNELNKSAHADLENVLKSFNDIRTSVAHDGIPVGINDTDIIINLKQIKHLIYHIDKTLFKHINKHTTNATWTT